MTVNVQAQIQALEQTNRILQKKLARAEATCLELDETNQKREAMLRALLQEVRESQTQLEQRSQELEAALATLQVTQTKLAASEQFLRLVMDNIPQAVFWKDRDSVYLGCNQNFAAIAGFSSPSEIIGKTDRDLPLMPEAAERYRARDQQIMQTDSPQHGIVEPQGQLDGSQRWLETSKVPLHDEQGQVIGVLGTYQDITARLEAEQALRQMHDDLEHRVEQRTAELHQVVAQLEQEIRERKQVEAQLLQQEQFLRSIYNGVDLEIFVVDVLEQQQFRYAGWNATKDRAFGISSQAAVGKSPQELFGRQGRRMEQRYRTCLEINTSLTYEEHLTLDQEKRWRLTTLNPVRDSQGQIYRIIGTAFDITERKWQEEALRLIVEGTASKTGDDFFQSCVRYLAEVLQMRYAYIAQLVDDQPTRARPLAVWTGDSFGTLDDYDLNETPCREVYHKAFCRYRSSVQIQFPDDRRLAEWNVESYIGIPITNPHGRLYGHIAVLDTQPVRGKLAVQESILRIFAARASAEIERQQAEAALMAREAQYRDLVQTVNGIILRWNVNTQIVFMNEYGLHLFGYAADELLGKSILDTIVPKKETTGRDLAFIVQDICIHPENYLFNENENICKNGERRWIVWANKPILDADGQLVEILSIGTDATERRQAEQALRESEIQLRQKADELEQALNELQHTQLQLVQSEKMSSLGQLVAGVAHEINNPVSFIHGNLTHVHQYTQDLLDLIALYQHQMPEPSPVIREKIEAIDLEFLTEDLTKVLRSMQVGSDRIREIVLSLRNFSRLDEAEFKAVNIHEGIENTLLIVQHRLKALTDRPAIEVVKAYGDLPLVECYPGQLNQVLMNLLVNAIDALEDQYDTLAPNTSYHPQIRISTWASESTVTIQIADNGPGIPPDVRAKLFDPFFTTKSVGKGTGLGLSISYQLVTQKHKGRLSCQSTPGQGAEFTIEIPIQHKGFAKLAG